MPCPALIFIESKLTSVIVFCREAGSPSTPVILLLHGLPTSSFQYRELIPHLADRYCVIAPDLPGFGFTEVPDRRGYIYNFDNLAKTMLAFTDALNIERYALYVFDYGAPTGFRMAMRGRLSSATGAIQLDRFLDHSNNVKLYTDFQQYFRQSKPLLLAIWGKHGPFSSRQARMPFAATIRMRESKFLDTGHFALETHVEEVASAMRSFLATVGY